MLSTDSYPEGVKTGPQLRFQLVVIFFPGVGPTPPQQFLTNVLRYVRYMLSAVRLLSVCLSVVCLSVCDVGAPYSGG